MAAGDVFDTGLVSKADGDYLDIVPASGEAIVHNVYVPVGVSVELYRSDGANDILIDSGSEPWIDHHFHVTAANYLRVKNVSGGAAFLSADGFVTAI